MWPVRIENHEKRRVTIIHRDGRVGAVGWNPSPEKALEEIGWESQILDDRLGELGLAHMAVSQWVDGPDDDEECGTCGGSGDETETIVEHDSDGHPVPVGEQIVGPCPDCQEQPEQSDA